MAQEYPLPRYHFQVDWGGSKISFTEVTGLVMEREKIEYRHSDSKDFNRIAMPGLVKNNNITLKRGKFESDFELNVWFDALVGDRVEPDVQLEITFELNVWFDAVANERVDQRRDVTIRLL